MGTRFSGARHAFDCDGCDAALEVEATNSLDAFAELRTNGWEVMERAAGVPSTPSLIYCPHCHKLWSHYHVARDARSA
jgi:hypothetical protein